jgi:hypothetical protein
MKSSPSKLGDSKGLIKNDWQNKEKNKEHGKDTW